MRLAGWVAFGAMWVGGRVAAQGKPITVTGTRGLNFGTVLPGVPVTVLRTDPANSGQFDIKGPKGQVLLSFVLPLTMTGPGGALLPLTFGASDAGYSQSQTIGSQVGFDPKQPFTATLSASGRGTVFIGATATAAANQRAGVYTATIILTVTILP